MFLLPRSLPKSFVSLIFTVIAPVFHLNCSRLFCTLRLYLYLSSRPSRSIKPCTRVSLGLQVFCSHVNSQLFVHLPKFCQILFVLMGRPIPSFPVFPQHPQESQDASLQLLRCISGSLLFRISWTRGFGLIESCQPLEGVLFSFQTSFLASLSFSPCLNILLCPCSPILPLQSP